MLGKHTIQCFRRVLLIWHVLAGVTAITRVSHQGLKLLTSSILLSVCIALLSMFPPKNLETFFQTCIVKRSTYILSLNNYLYFLIHSWASQTSTLHTAHKNKTKFGKLIPLPNVITRVQELFHICFIDRMLLQLF